MLWLVGGPVVVLARCWRSLPMPPSWNERAGLGPMDGALSLRREAGDEEEYYEEREKPAQSHERPLSELIGCGHPRDYGPVLRLCHTHAAPSIGHGKPLFPFSLPDTRLPCPSIPARRIFGNPPACQAVGAVRLARQRCPIRPWHVPSRRTWLHPLACAGTLGRPERSSPPAPPSPLTKPPLPSRLWPGLSR